MASAVRFGTWESSTGDTFTVDEVRALFGVTI